MTWNSNSNFGWDGQQMTTTGTMGMSVISFVLGPFPSHDQCCRIYGHYTVKAASGKHFYHFPQRKGIRLAHLKHRGRSIAAEASRQKPTDCVVLVSASHVRVGVVSRIGVIAPVSLHGDRRLNEGDDAESETTSARQFSQQQGQLHPLWSEDLGAPEGNRCHARH